MSYEAVIDVMAAFVFGVFFVLVAVDSLSRWIDRGEERERVKHREAHGPRRED